MKYLALFTLAICALFGAGAAIAEPASAAMNLAEFSDLLMGIGLAGIVVNSANLKIIFTGFKTAFMRGRGNAPSYWERIATEVPSTTSEEKYGWLGAMKRMREWIGDRVIHGLKLHDYTIKNKKFEVTHAVERDMIDDDRYGVLAPVFEEAGYSSRTHPDELVFELLAAGFSTLCYDGQNFFDTDHPVGSEEDGTLVSVSNMQAGSGNPWFLLDTRRPLKPLIFQKRRDYDFRSITNLDSEHVMMTDEFVFGVDARVNVGFGLWQQAFGSKAELNDTNFDAAMETMMAFKDDSLRPLGIMPNLLVCGPSNRSKAKVVIDKELIKNGESNTNYKAVEVLVVPWLA